MYLLKLSLRVWKIAPLSQTFSAIAVGFLLVLIGFLFWIQQGLQPILARLQTEQVVTAYLSSSVDPKGEASLLDEVRQVIGPENSAEVKLITAPQFVTLLKNQYPDLGRELEDLGQEMFQVIPRYISITGTLGSFSLEKIRGIHGIESAESSKDRYRPIVGAFSVLRWVTRVLMVGVILALLTGLIHLSRMNIYLHHDALSLLKFWGAGRGTLAVPGVISGLVVGILGGAIASTGWLTAGNSMVHHIRAISSILKGMPTVHSHIAMSLFIAGCGVGTISGFLGSLSIFRLNDSGDRGGMSA